MTPQALEDTRWEAVLRRDPAAAEAFVYAVRSTGIYCRPTCPARRPGRDRVAFYPDAAAAAAAGFRPCRRCAPEAARPEPFAAERALLEGDEPPTLAELAARAGQSPAHFQRAFTRAVGVSPREYADACRVRRLRGELRAAGSVTEALYAAGYGSSSRLYERAADHLGMTPGAYRRGGAGEQIAYALADAPLGRLLVAATARGLCGVALGDGDGELLAWLRGQYPAAALAEDADGLGEWLAVVLAIVAGREPDPALPLDVRGTAFQRQVWQALREIPRGETRSYAEVAAAVGRPKAGRAVARACALNRAALVIPCHRVIGSDGSLTGYRWGVERKRKLLEAEQAPEEA